MDVVGCTAGGGVRFGCVYNDKTDLGSSLDIYWGCGEGRLVRCGGESVCARIKLEAAAVCGGSTRSDVIIADG